MLSNKRLVNEIKQLKKEPVQDIDIIIDDNNIYQMIANVRGPEETIYSSGTFKLLIRIPDDYPIKPPSIKFMKPIFHPNIYRDGKICLDVLLQEWSPVQNIRTILISIRSLLADPNPNSPANREAATLYLKDINEFNKRALESIK
ncbi:ubiquitin-conjugating enzyme E2 2-like isoform X1 [Chlorella virus XW01]|nr:ubiquitin-conjugating enzyme E2 2-like isoform X1 [Chlorella virus XW01]